MRKFYRKFKLFFYTEMQTVLGPILIKTELVDGTCKSQNNFPGYNYHPVKPVNQRKNFNSRFLIKVTPIKSSTLGNAKYILSIIIVSAIELYTKCRLFRIASPYQLWAAEKIGR